MYFSISMFPYFHNSQSISVFLYTAFLSSGYTKKSRFCRLCRPLFTKRIKFAVLQSTYYTKYPIFFFSWTILSKYTLNFTHQIFGILFSPLPALGNLILVYRKLILVYLFFYQYTTKTYTSTGKTRPVYPVYPFFQFPIIEMKSIYTKKYWYEKYTQKRKKIKIHVYITINL